MIAVIITGDFYARSFLNVQVLNKLLRDYDVLLIKQSGVLLEDSLKTQFSAVVDFDFNKTRKNYSILFFQELLCWRFRKRSKTFLYKSKRKYPSVVQQLESKVYKRKGIQSAKSIKVSSVKVKSDASMRVLPGFSFLILKLREFLIKVLSIKCFLLIFIRIARIHQIIDSELHSILSFYSVKLIIFPTGSMVAHDQIISNTAKKSGIDTFYLMDNWDNISSKSVFWSLPTFVGTWGPQTTKHAIEIQGFKPNQIIQIGSARFSNYLDSDKFMKSSQYNFKYILFIGSYYRYKELELLMQLDRYISQNSGVYRDIRVIYRPYPGSERIRQFQTLNLNNIQLDSATITLYEQELLKNDIDKLKVKMAPSNYYPELIGNSLFCIGGLSSMILEATLMNKMYLAIAFSEKHNILSPHNYLESFTHLEEIEILPNLKICRNDNILFSHMDKLMQRKEVLTPEFTKSALSYFLNTETNNFDERLLASVDFIFEEKGKNY